jgi:hypothetical protein
MGSNQQQSLLIAGCDTGLRSLRLEARREPEHELVITRRALAHENDIALRRLCRLQFRRPAVRAFVTFEVAIVSDR